MVSAEALLRIKRYAGSSPNREICGVVDTQDNVYPIINVSTVPSDFVLSRSGYGRALRTIKGLGQVIKCVYHSHLNGDAAPSIHDLASSAASHYDYLIVAGDIHTYTVCGEVH